MPHTHRVELGSMGLTGCLQEAVGAACVVYYSNAGEAYPLTGNLTDLTDGQTVIRLDKGPASVPEQVTVTIPSRGVSFEAKVVTSGPEELALSYPLWLSQTERRREERVPAQLPCRVAKEEHGQVRWLSGTIVNVNTGGVCVRAPLQVAPGTPFLIRVVLPGQSVALLLRLQCVWYKESQDENTIGAQFIDLSVQAETTLRRTLGLLPPYPSPSEEFLQRALVESGKLSLQVPLLRGRPVLVNHPLLNQGQNELATHLQAMWETRSVRQWHISRGTERMLVYLIPITDEVGLLVGQDLTDLTQVSRRYHETVLQTYRDVLYAATEGKLLVVCPQEIDEFIRSPIWSAHHTIRSSADIAVCRKLTHTMLKAQGLPGRKILEFTLSVSEAVTNVVKHAGEGEFRLIHTEEGFTAAVADGGPGIDLPMLPHTTLLRGFSTKPSLGLGFTAMLRCLDRLVLSTSPAGTTLLLQLLGQHGGGKA